jgi:hypothetical protein
VIENRAADAPVLDCVMQRTRTHAAHTTGAG